jgi:hypothetical protein
MKNKAYVWIALAILGIGGYLAYKEFKKVKVLTKEDSINIIIENGKHKDRNIISTFDDAFLGVWANAILENIDTFVYKGKSYRTQGGTALK